MRFNFFFGVLGVVSAVCAAPSPTRPYSHTARELLNELSALNTTATAWTTDYTTVKNFPREEQLQIEVFYDSNIDEGHTVKHLDEKVKATIRALETESRTLSKDSQVEYKFKGNPHFGDRRCGFIYRFVGEKNYYHAYVRLGQIKKGKEDQEGVVRVLVERPGGAKPEFEERRDTGRQSWLIVVPSLTFFVVIAVIRFLKAPLLGALSWSCGLCLPRCSAVHLPADKATVFLNLVPTIMNTLPTQILPEALFLSSRLTSLVAVEAALTQFEALVNVNHQRPGILIAELLQTQKSALPLVISCVHDDAFNLLRAHISDLFQEPKLFGESVALELLVNLSHFLYFHDMPPSILQSQDLIRTYYPTVQNAPVVLKSLSMAEFSEDSSIPEDGQVNSFGIRVRRKPKGQKHTRTKSKALDPKPFKSLGLEVPSTRFEAEKLTLQVLKTLENILNSYLDLVRDTNIGTAIKTSFISQTAVDPTTYQDLTPSARQEDQAPTEDVTQLAFPKVQPMKSALHFDSIDGFGEWAIFISQNADTELRTRHRRDKTSFDIIVKKIKELSNGHFSADNQKRLSGPNSEVPVFEAKMTSDLRLIYQIDIVANDDERERQAIKIFGIYTHAQMDNRMWESISRQLDRKGKEYRDRCAIRIRAEHAADRTFVPAFFPPLPETEEDESFNWLADENPVHSRFLMDKYVVFSQPLLNTMLADLDATFPHLVSAKEKQIIEHPQSCYVIGRSGTGKTTTLLFKMLLVERTHQMSGANAPKPRQIFVTQSRILAKKVEQYFVTLGRSLIASSQSLSNLCEIRASQRGNVLDDEYDMIHVDDIVDWSGDLPSKFSDLRDEHFPLFTTFNGLCAMLEADIANAESKKHPKSLIPLNASERGSLTVTYEVFLRDYWPHFSQSIAGKLDPSLVFSELIGVIKASEETLEGTKHFLDRAAYHNLSTRSQSTFAENREDLYELFMAYLAKKKRFGDVDGADRAHEILDFFKLQGIPGQRLDHLYVDEVQDNLLIDTLILRLLCHDENGLFWAGDTAQTISVGSSFRFNSLKAFQWRLEENRRSTSSNSQAAIEPQTFQLSVNYRSHSGIVDCAHSIIELITRFWKDSIDRLAPEKGVVAGLKPLFFVGWDEDTAGLDHFVFGDSGNRIEFGAQQCILVRNEAARDRLKLKLGDGVGLIMTIYDSKGLEFNDVLLYDFFGDSPAKLAQWRLILSALNDRSVVTAPEFERNKQRYASICTELKFLYVAITRARENVWIVDSSESSEPMRMYWTERDLVRNIEPGTNAPKLATSSSPEDWARQGDLLFERKKWAEAKHCFERALQPEKVAIAEAYRLREKAERSSLDKSNAKLRNAQFHEAAEAFYQCSRSARRKRISDFVRLSGTCYEKAGEFLLAARNYNLARRFNDSVRCYRKADRYDEAVKIVQTETDVEPSLVADTIRVAKMFYFNQVQSLPSCLDRDKKLQQAGSLFDTVDAQLEYLEDRDMDIARAVLLVAHGRTREAAELHLAEGRTLEAIDYFLQDTDTDHENSARRATECILDGLWRKLTFCVPPDQMTEDFDFVKLFQLTKKINQSSLTPNSRDELAMFQAIVDKDQHTLRKLGIIFLKANSLSSALLCLDHYYNPPLPFDNLTVYEMADELDLFRRYAQLLLDLLTNPRPADQLGLCKLFGVLKLSDSHILLSSGSFLHRSYPNVSSGHDLQLDMMTFMRYFRSRVSNRLRELSSGIVTGKHLVTMRISQQHPSPAPFTIQGQEFIYNNSIAMVTQRSFWLSRLYDALFPSSHIIGTLAIAQFQSIVEYPEALQTLQQWIHSFIYSRPYLPVNTFLSDLTRIGTLAMVFDKPHALSTSLLRRGSYTRLHPPPLFLRRGGGHIVYELIGFIEDHPQPNPQCLDAAVLTLWHIMANSVPIEIGLLCDILERLCRSLVLASSSSRDLKLHNVTLPRSWLMKPICVEEERRKHFSQLPNLIIPIGDLLAQVYTGRFAEHLMYENRNLTSNVPIRVRTIFISRMAISLLGYNFGDNDFRLRILNEITSLRTVRQAETPFPFTYRFYVEARQWSDIAHAVRHSTRGSTMDEMINVVHKDRYNNTRFAPSGVRIVVYDKIESLPQLLVEGIPPAAPSINDNAPRDVRLRATAAPFESSLTQFTSVTVQAEATPGQGDSDDVTMDLNTEPIEQVEDVAQQTIPSSIDNTLDNPLVQEPEILEATEDEHQNATIIQQAYRRYSTRKVKERTQLSVSRDKWFDEYLKMKGVPDGRYRKMMLGPLPHILVFIDLLHIGTQELKNSTKKRLRLPLKSEEADSLDKQLTRTNNVIKKSLKWKKTLEPQSDFHSCRDCLQLRAFVKEIEELIQNELPELPIKMSLDTRSEFDLGYKGIAQEPVPRKAVPSKPPKPELNTEDVL
ncbi:hypothetical protein F5051DRAFT_453113 [Lentinula edodes]|nr:hypothetical protein F5051DRAFT_453113 [Lentinula edodes]